MFGDMQLKKNSIKLLMSTNAVVLLNCFPIEINYKTLSYNTVLIRMPIIINVKQDLNTNSQSNIICKLSIKKK